MLLLLTFGGSDGVISSKALQQYRNAYKMNGLNLINKMHVSHL